MSEHCCLKDGLICFTCLRSLPIFAERADLQSALDAARAELKGTQAALEARNEVCKHLNESRLRMVTHAEEAQRERDAANARVLDLETKLASEKEWSAHFQGACEGARKDLRRVLAQIEEAREAIRPFRNESGTWVENIRWAVDERQTANARAERADADATRLMVEGTREIAEARNRASAAIAERDTALSHVAVLRSALENAVEEHASPNTLWATASNALSQTDSAAQSFVARIRREIADKAAAVFKANYVNHTAASIATERAIRALAEKEGKE